MDSPFVLDGIKLLAVVVLVLANGFFVAAEFSLVSVRRTRIKELISKGDVSAGWVKKAIDNPDAVIAATQLGRNLPQFVSCNSFCNHHLLACGRRRAGT
jgi:CBS domain containing-hemolysin-like protein